MTDQAKTTVSDAPDFIWATPTRLTFNKPDWSQGEYYDEYGADGMGVKYIKADLGDTHGITEATRSFLVALLASDTWIEAGAVWDQNPTERKAALTFLSKAQDPTNGQ